MSYSSDRAFTDHVHYYLAMPRIYKPLGWVPLMLIPSQAHELDVTQAIDYVFENAQKKIVTVQERFREVKYKGYNDFTIRYRRDENKVASRHESEYYKMKADYFVYGITNGSKDNGASLNDFEKFAVVDLSKVYEQIDNKQILIQDNGRNFCSLSGNQIICPVKHNHDQSSSFFPVDIGFLARLWPSTILAQRGFID